MKEHASYELIPFAFCKLVRKREPESELAYCTVQYQGLRRLIKRVRYAIHHQPGSISYTMLQPACTPRPYVRNEVLKLVQHQNLRKQLQGLIDDDKLYSREYPERGNCLPLVWLLAVDDAE